MAYDKERVLYLLQQPKTKEVVEEIIKLNKGLIGKQLQKFGLVRDHDALSLGFEALYNAAMTYDPTKNSVFSTYATVCIYNRLGSYVRSLKTLTAQNTISYNEYIDDEGTTHLDRMASKLTADGALMDREGVDTIHKVFRNCFKGVRSQMHRDVLQLWYDSNFTLTHNEIGNQLGCSQSYVNQIINKFRKELKNKLEGNL